MQHRICRNLLHLILIGLILILPSGLHAEDRTLTLGVLAIRPKPEMTARWQPLADYLSRSLDGYQVTLVPLEQQEMAAAIESRQLDLLFTNASDYIKLRSKNSMTGALATLNDLQQGQPVSSLGGVIFTRHDRHDIKQLEDLKDKTLACFSITGSLGSFPAPARELLEVGIRLPRQARMLITGTPQDLVVKAVLDKRADAGFVRTGVLEHLVAAGRLSMDQIKIINRQNLSSYPFIVSTTLYPEWPVVALPHLDPEIGRRIAAALLLLEPDSPTARTAQIHGFTIPADYTPVEELLRDLRLPPYDAAPHFTLLDIWNRYALQLLLGAIAISSIVMLAVRLAVVNRTLRQSRTESEKTATLLQTVLQTIPDLVWLKDANGIYLACNPRFEQFFGASEAEIIGKTDYDFVDRDLADFFREHDRIAMAKGSPSSNEDTIVFAVDGHTEQVETIKCPMYAKDGTLAGVLGIGRNITERKQAAEQLQQATLQAVELARRADAANRAKSELLATLSHELRTPLNGVMGGTQLLEMTDLSDEQTEYLQMIRSSATNELALVNDLLDLAGLEASGVELVEEPFSIPQCINLATTLHCRALQERGLELNTTLEESLQQTVIGDSRRLTQIVANLLSNAVKFTSQGSISIKAEAAPCTGNKLRLRLSVTDTGIGIPTQHQDRIFEPFVQVDMSSTREYGGTGMGLAISRKLAQRMGGTLQVSSSPGEGSCFILELPLKIAGGNDQQQPDLQTGLLPSWGGRPLTVVVAEDNEINQQTAAGLLTRLGLKPLCASDGKQAVAFWLAGGVDAMLMDIQMPVMDGHKALQFIRQREQGSDEHLPVIAVTAHAMLGDRERLLAEGFDGYVAKPFQLQELLAELTRVTTAHKES